MISKEKSPANILPNGMTLKRVRISGILLGVLALLACELPIILAVVGMGGLSAATVYVQPGPIVVFGAVAMPIAGIATLLFLRGRRRKIVAKDIA